MVDVFFRRARIFAIGLAILIVLISLVGCGRKDAVNVAVISGEEASGVQTPGGEDASESDSQDSGDGDATGNTEPQVPTEDPEFSEDPSFVDGSTIAMETLLMLPEVMEYFGNGMSVVDMQELVQIEGGACYKFGVGAIDGNGNTDLQIFYAVDSASAKIWKQDSASGDWIAAE